MDWLILVDLDLNMELAKGFGREMKTPRPGDGGMGWDGRCWFCAGEWDSEWCVRKKRRRVQQEVASGFMLVGREVNEGLAYFWFL